MGRTNPDYRPMLNLGWLADNGYEIEGHCKNCNRFARVAVIPLAKRYGYYMQIDAIGAQLKCQICGDKRIDVRRVKWSDGVPKGWRPGDR